MPSTRTSASSACGPYDEVSTKTSRVDRRRRRRRGRRAARGAPARARRPAPKSSRSDGNSARPRTACQPHQAACSCVGVADDRCPPRRQRDRPAARDELRARGARRPACRPPRRPAGPCAARSHAAGESRSVAGTCTPTKPSRSRPASSSRSGSTIGHRGPGAEVLRAARARPRARRRAAPPASGRTRFSIPSGAERETQASADPVLVVRRDAPLHVVVRRVDVVAPARRACAASSPAGTACACVRAAGRRAASGQRCWCTSVARAAAAMSPPPDVLCRTSSGLIRVTHSTLAHQPPRREEVHEPDPAPAAGMRCPGSPGLPGRCSGTAGRH